MMLQLRDAIKEKAGAIGVKNFITKWNAFLSEKRKAEGRDIENVTDFDILHLVIAIKCSIQWWI